jgi:hypothetical protein
MKAGNSKGRGRSTQEQQAWEASGKLQKIKVKPYL